MSKLILPGDPEFLKTLATPPPDWGNVRSRTNGNFALVARAGSGILEAVPEHELDDYLYGGEWDEREEELEGEDELDGFGEYYA